MELPLTVDSSPERPLFERESVLAELQGLLSAFSNGQGRVIAVSGEAGVGKTSVLRTFAKSVPDTFLVLQGCCEDLMASRPLGPLFDMAGRLDPELLNFLAEGRDHAYVINHMLMAIQRSRMPVVMIIEDIHWADDATLDLVKFLGRRTASLPLLLLVSHRDDELGRKYAIGRALGSIAPQDLRRISLLPLSAAAVSEMARARGRDGGEIHSITNGNPFFVTEILANGAGATIPGSVRDAVWARIERCPIEQRVVLEALSIVPGGGHRDLIHHLVTTPQAEQLDQLIDAGIFVLDGQIIRFRHELARQSTFLLLTESRKRSLHRAAGDWLAKHVDAQTLSTLAQRIHHASAAGDGAVVVKLAPDVARRAAHLGAHRQAAQFLALALAYVDQLPPDEAAQVFESWSYESGLAEQIDDRVIDARHKAIALWRQVGRIEKIGLNYRWLSRLHWYRGEADEAKRYAEMAIEILESTSPGPELAWSYSVRSQWAMLNDQFDDAISWGEQAIGLADRFGETEIRVHALNNIGTSLLLSNDSVRGRALMDESLQLALKHQFHEQAARVYTNMAEYALAVRDLDLAQHYLDDGIAFDTEHDLGSWLHYLRGCNARYLMLRGELEAAEALARDVLEVPDQTRVMQLPATSVLAQVSSRLGRPSAEQELQAVLEIALATKEPQRIAPIRIALAERAWISGDMEGARSHVEAAFSANHAVHPWDVGELCSWAFRTGQPIVPLPDNVPDPVLQECSGNTQAAADAYGRMGMPFEQAVVLSTIGSGGNYRTLDEINIIISSLRNRLKDDTRFHRTQYTAARHHPAGLTFKEQQVLRLLNEGASNALIASKLNRSIRTVEHHVAAVLAKLGINNRQAVVARVSEEPNLLA
jgi:DNA-binding CsgD family transcriptional regulator/tetratricopeptide (TPR) repeat protein